MSPTLPDELGSDRASLDALWSALDRVGGEPDPWVRAVMITSIDGTSTVDGLSGGLGTPTDRRVFDAMRARADLVVVGARTAMDEGYGPAVVADPWTDRRSGPPPTVVLLARSLTDEIVDYCRDRGGRGFAVAVPGPVEAGLRDAAEAAGTDVHELDTGSPGPALRTLAARLGAREVVCEGGPRLLGALLECGNVDEIVLSYAPVLHLGGDTTRLAVTDGDPTSHEVRVVTAFTAPDGGLYTRWAVGPEAG